MSTATGNPLPSCDERLVSQAISPMKPRHLTELRARQRAIQHSPDHHEALAIELLAAHDYWKAEADRLRDLLDTSDKCGTVLTAQLQKEKAAHRETSDRLISQEDQP